MALDCDKIGNGGGEVDFIICLVVANYPAYSFYFCILGETGANDADIDYLFISRFSMSMDEEYGIVSTWYSCSHPLR